MKKMILCGAVLAALLAMSTLASAAEPTLVAHHGGRGHGCRSQQTLTTCQNGAQCSAFYDENDDGICDHLSSGGQQTCQDGAQCSAFYDENDDGICDHLSSGGHHRRHRTWTA